MSDLNHSRAIGSCVAAVLALGLLGCSMHPLPENVSRASTFDIVERVRCEVLDGLNDFGPEERARADKIIAATKIGYDFDFTIKESSDGKSGELQYKRAAFKGDNKGFFLDLSTEAAKERSNKRAFRIIDNLSDLHKERGERCSRVTTIANGLYPITGATGMAEVVRTYVKLEMLSDLVRTGDNGQVFSDELIFTTKFSAGVSPTLELRTIAGEFRLKRLSLAGTAAREDTHTVTVALTRGPGEVDILDTVAELSGDRSRGFAALQGEPLIRPYRTLRRFAANQAGPETRILYELQRRRNIRDDAKVVNRILHGTD